MSDNNFSLLSEDDIRTKVVYPWLKDCGFSDKDICIEYSIKLRIGKGLKTINSRTDILVKSINGSNLLIVEVKRPNHSLNEKDKQQALSYARSLAEGGIAPFTVLTNGKNIAIYDSITGDKIIGNVIPSTHPYVENGFRVSGNSLIAKAEALEYLISLSADNLLVFCNAQVKYRMELLKSEDLFSGKKYIPQLHVKRFKAREELDKKLFGNDENKSNQFVLVVGSPQHGKTCFMCNTIESYLKKGIPILFYPAISLKNGLLNEIQEDFEWFFGNQNNPSQLINKLCRITQQAGKEIIIFIDGWNEMIEQALFINDECQRLQQSNIKIVLSTTSPSVSRLLQDEAANLTFIAGEAKFSAAAIQKLTTQPLENTKELSIVQIGKFDDYELKRGQRLHERAYNTKFPDDNNLPKDPFYLRIAAEVYTNNIVPSFATGTQLIKMGLLQRAARRGIRGIDLFSTLNDIAGIIVEKDAPFSCIDLPIILRSEKELSSWIESAIFIHLHNKEISEIDFYYTHEKDYSIAILNRRLHETLCNSKEEVIFRELQCLLKTESGQNALRWLFSCPEYASILKNVFMQLVLKIENHETIAKILADSIFNQVNLNNNFSYNWLDEYITVLISNQVYQHNSYNILPSLIYSLLKSVDEDKEKEKFKHWMRLLVKYDKSKEELGVEESFVCQFYGVDGFKGYLEDEQNTTLDIDFFERLIFDVDFEISSNAADYLTYAFPMFMLNKLPLFNQYYEQNNRHGFNQIIKKSCCYIISEMDEMYYGGICPGALDGVEKGDFWVEEEYYKQKNLWSPVLKIMHDCPELYASVLHILNHLAEYIEEEDLYLPKPPMDDPNQLKLDF
jgi:hypothetical protein